MAEQFTIADLRARLSILDARLAKAQVAYERAGREVAEIAEQRRGAEAFIALLEEPVLRPKKPANGSVTNVVLDIFGEHPEGIANTEIHRIALDRGYEFDAEQIRSSVAYLSRRGDVESTGERGFWRLKNTAPSNENGPADAEPFTLSALPPRAVVQTG